MGAFLSEGDPDRVLYASAANPHPPYLVEGYELAHDVPHKLGARSRGGSSSAGTSRGCAASTSPSVERPSPTTASVVRSQRTDTASCGAPSSTPRRFRRERASSTAADAVGAAVAAALDAVDDPCMVAAGAPTSIIDLGLVDSVDVEDGIARIAIPLTEPGCPFTHHIVADITDAAASVDGIERVEVAPRWAPLWTEERMTAAERRDPRRRPARAPALTHVRERGISAARTSGGLRQRWPAEVAACRTSRPRPLGRTGP